MKKRRRRTPRWARVGADSARVVCPFCSQTLTIPIDRSAGTSQKFVYDCEVCCSPMVIALELDGEDVQVQAARES